MKRLLLLAGAMALACLSVASTGAQQTSATATQITAAWNAASTWNTAPLCSSTVTSSCLTDLSLSFKDPIGSAANTVSGIATTATSYVWKPGGNLFCGTTPWNITLTANYLDASGNPLLKAASVTAPVPCPFNPNPPSGLKATPGV